MAFDLTLFARKCVSCAVSLRDSTTQTSDSTVAIFVNLYSPLLDLDRDLGKLPVV